MSAQVNPQVNVPLEDNELRQKYVDMEEYFGEKQLRWVQIAIRNAIAQALNDQIRTNLIVLPTGCGKTITIACTLGNQQVYDALGVTGRKLRVVFIAHVHRLLTQAERTFADDNGVQLKVHTPHSDMPEEDFAWADVVVIDEAHHEAMMSVQLQLEKMANVPVIGLTATPDRADGMVIKFENIIQPITREQAVEEGWLAPTSLWSFIDTSGRDKTPVICDILREYHHQMEGTLIFCKTKKEVRAVTTFIRDVLGKQVVALLEQKSTEVNTILDEFSEGKHQFIVNCAKLGEGIDVVGCSDVILGEQVGSYPKLNQIIGRSARPDSDSRVYELINPLSGTNLDTTVVIGTPEKHTLCSPVKGGTFIERQFDYVGSEEMPEHNLHMYG